MAYKNEILNGKAVIGKGESMVRVWVREIIYLQGNVNYTIFYTTNGQYFSAKNLSFWENQLAENNLDFLRIHRMYLVNRSHISQIEDTQVKVSNRDVLKISRRNYKKIK